MPKKQESNNKQHKSFFDKLLKEANTLEHQVASLNKILEKNCVSKIKQNKPEKKKMNRKNQLRPLLNDLLEEADTLEEQVEDVLNILEGNDQSKIKQKR